MSQKMICYITSMLVRHLGTFKHPYKLKCHIRQSRKLPEVHYMKAGLFSLIIYSPFYDISKYLPPADG